MKKMTMMLGMCFDADGNRVVENRIAEAAAWLLDRPDAVPTQKIDGTAAMWDGNNWFTRRAVRRGKLAPNGFIAVETDCNTGRTYGWEPAENSGYHKMMQVAITNLDYEPNAGDTFELVGPRIQKNMENVDEPTLIKHGSTVMENFPTVAEIAAHREDPIGFLTPYFEKMRDDNIEGVVWWVDGVPAFVKLRVCDFFPDR